MTAIAKVGRRGQITIPRAIRRRLEVKEGDSVAFVYQDDDIVIKALNRTLLDLRGSVPVSGPQDFGAIRFDVLETRAARRVQDNG
jgi:AbrB family looped-hinge helix DNA binding protein